MLPVLTAEQIRKADAYTIENEPIASVDLMERASRAFVKKFVALAGRGHQIILFCGIGNNGGDGLAVARLLKEQGYSVRVFVCGKTTKGSPDFKINLERLSLLITISFIDSPEHFPLLDQEVIVIDALFGSGLSRPLDGIYAQLVNHVNDSKATIYSVDIASGLYTDKPIEGNAIITPRHTISFQCPKAAFFHPTHARFVGEWHIVDIGLDQNFIYSQDVQQYFSTASDFEALIPERSLFAHKGTAGRVKIITGSRGKMGASVLCARAVLRAGAGLLFVQVPGCGRDILQISVPEAMVIEDRHLDLISEINDISYDAIAIGPGIGTGEETVKAMIQLLTAIKNPMVIDADALNILSQNMHLLKEVPPGSILTPHPGEFERLVGKWSDDYEKVELLRSFARKYKISVVLKGAYSLVCAPSGVIYYNCSGNPGMASGGSGDVLTGLIAGLLGQIKDPFKSLLLGVYLHGLAGDLAAEKIGLHGMIASDITDFIPSAIKKIIDQR